LDLTYKAPPSSHHLAKFRGDRPIGGSEIARKPFAPNFFGWGPKFGTVIV